MTRTTKATHATQATKLRFVGSPDHYVDGVPQGDLAIVATPADETQVTPERALELVATGLYAPIDGVLEPVQSDEGAVAPGEGE